MPSKSCFLAAIDLGSNSFRLEVGRYHKGQLARTAYLREPIRLGRGLNENAELDLAFMKRGWSCLRRFDKYLHKQKIFNVRAVATQTLRQAVNRDVFIEKGQKILGFPIEVISGQQEANLTYLGVCALLDKSKTRFGKRSTENRLVLDIGGRSTELIVGKGPKPLAGQSCSVGSVGLSMDFFANGLLAAQQFERACACARAHFEQAIAQMKEATGAPLIWDKAYGASGTIGAISSVLKKNKQTDGCITRPALEWIYQQLLHARSCEAISMPGLGERKDVIGGGVSILRALFDIFENLHTLYPARGALRQGLLYDMIDSLTQTQHQQTHS